MVSAEATLEARNAAEAAAGRGEEVLELDPAVFEKVSSTRSPQGIAAVFPIPSWRSSDVFSGGTVVALDGVSDPGNAGTIIRSAAAFRCSGAVFLPESACPYGPKVTRASAGHNISLPIITAGSLLPLRESHPDYTFAGAEPDGERFDRFLPGGPVCLVVGSEARGLSPDTLGAVQAKISIPIAPGVESLNAGVCASIMLHRLDGNCAGPRE